MENSQTIIFFDGLCHLCNYFVDLLIRKDSLRQLRFAPLQGSTAEKYLSLQDRTDLVSVILLHQGKLYYQSEAVILALLQLQGLFQLAKIFNLLPKPVLDFFYLKIAKYRKALFGARLTCRIPTPQEREFLLP